MVRDILASACGAVEDKLDSSDVFSTYLYTGNGTTQTINNGIDLAGKGGMVWIKNRSNGSQVHRLFDTHRGVNKSLSTNDTTAEFDLSDRFTAFNSSGFSLGADSVYGDINYSGRYQASWTFSKATKFFDVVTWTGNGVAGRQIPHNLGCEVGMIVTKATSTTDDWNTYHRSATGDLKLNLTNAKTASRTIITSASTTTFTVSGVANTNGATYVAYLFANDPSADGIIQCGSFTNDGSGNATVDLGWEPQYVMFKPSSAVHDWSVLDSMRGFTAPPLASSATLRPNTSGVEDSYWATVFGVNATGFTVTGTAASWTFVYLAIRRPMKVPTSGSEVYNAIARTGTGVAATVTGVGFAPDLAIIDAKNRTDFHIGFYDRLRGKGATLYSPLADAEINNTNALGGFDVSDGYRTSIGGAVNMSGALYINHFFKRAKGFFDNFCWTGTGVNRTIAHNLGVAPELLILKSRSDTRDWQVWFSGLASNEKLVLNSTAAKVTDATLLNSTLPTSTLISLGIQAAVNTSSATYVGYAFASLAGVQKIGAYVGNGTMQNLNFGFSAGVRFFLCKAVTTTGSYWVFDSVRGIVASTDFGLQLNSTAAEVTSADCVDPFVGGISVVEEATCHLNTNGVTYMYWAIA